MATPKMNRATKEAIERKLKEGHSHRAISDRLGVSLGSISNVRNGLISEEVELKRAKRIAAVANQKEQDAIREIERLEAELNRVIEIQASLDDFRPVIITPKHGGKGEATAIICANDWHFEEKVDRAAVNGVNEYNLAIAGRRAQKFWASVSSLIDMCRSRSRIDSIVVNLLGDFITGVIHEELMATNTLTPAEATVAVFEQLVSGLGFLKKETKAKEIIAVCVCGNHGRFTKKQWNKKGPGMSFEWMLYKLMAKWFAAQNNKVVRFVLPQGAMTYITVYGRVIRVMHGDNINYGGGIGGVHIPLRKAIDTWNTQVRADYNYLGHWHTDLTGEDYRISGSMIGFNEYSIRIKARFQRPSQAFELQHPRYGATARFPIILE
jgi:transcriptional regulator with XRE-family HTH domain